VLVVENVSKYYGSLPALRNVSFEARAGQVVGYLGPNGSGKSTTVKLVTGLLPPTRGRIRYDGADIHDDLLRYRRRVGYVPEVPELYTYLTGPEYLTLVGSLRNIPAGRLEEKIERLLELFELDHARHATLSSYSKGMKQKVLLCAALMHDPEVVVLDEPTSGLDVSSVLVLKQLISALAAAGKVVLYSSHVLEMVEQVSDRVIILREGEIVASDSVARLRELEKQPNLEAVFTRLAVREDVSKVAREILEAMEL
jgi:ABC-2 type transport system ATP-binding protein